MFGFISYILGAMFTFVMIKIAEEKDWIEFDRADEDFSLFILCMIWPVVIIFFVAQAASIAAIKKIRNRR